MKQLSRWLVGIFAILTLHGPEAGAAGRKPWLTVQSKHFTLVSCAGEGRSRELIEILERFRSVVAEVYQMEPPAAPVTMLVFEDEAGFRPFKPVRDGKPSANAALTSTGGPEDLVALSAERGEQALDVILHEYTHVLTAAGASFWPAWLAEGEAEVMSTFRWKDGQATLGQVKNHHVTLLREKAWLPLERLLDATTKSPEYNERDRQNLFYAESWALVHYFRYGDRGAHRELLQRYVGKLSDGRSSQAAFREVFGDDLRLMERDLRRYIEDGTYQPVTPRSELRDVASEITVRAVDEAELNALLGTWLVAVERADAAEKYFEKCGDAPAARGRVEQWRGYRAYKARDFVKAAEHWEKAVVGQSENYLAWYYYASALMQARIGESFELGKGDRKACRQIEQAATRAVELMPRYAPAYGLLAATHLASGLEIPAGVRWAEEALRLAPQNFNYRLTLAQLQLSQTNFVAARVALEPLLKLEGDPAVRKLAESVMKLIKLSQQKVGM